MLATLADMLVVPGCNVQAEPGRFMSTVSLSTDFLAPVARDARRHSGQRRATRPRATRPRVRRPRVRRPRIRRPR